MEDVKWKWHKRVNDYNIANIAVSLNCLLLLPEMN